MSHYALPTCLRVQGAPSQGAAAPVTVVRPSITPLALWAAVSVFVSAAVAGLFAFGAKRSGASHASAATWGLLGGLAPLPLTLIGGAYLRGQTMPRGDVALSAEESVEKAGQQLVVHLPEWTKERLRKQAKALGKPVAPMNANVREKPWGTILTGLPEGTVVEEVSSTIGTAALLTRASTAKSPPSPFPQAPRPAAASASRAGSSLIAASTRRRSSSLNSPMM